MSDCMRALVTEVPRVVFKAISAWDDELSSYIIFPPRKIRTMKNRGNQDKTLVESSCFKHFHSIFHHRSNHIQRLIFT
jgi:hypothetical protein